MLDASSMDGLALAVPDDPQTTVTDRVPHGLSFLARPAPSLSTYRRHESAHSRVSLAVGTGEFADLDLTESLTTVHTPQ